MNITDPQFLTRLESLYLLARKVIGGSLAADRRSNKKGSGINFADYKEYQFGDDYRNIDWNIFARLESLVVKLFELEEDVSIFILFDISPSMQSKLEYAKCVAAALGYISLCNQDKLTIYSMSDQLFPLIEPCHGKGKVMSVLQTLEQVNTTGKNTNFNDCMKVFQKRHRAPGVCVVISDFFFRDGFEEGLRFLKYSKNDIFCIQVLDPAETSCDYRGDITLECIESGEQRLLTVGPKEKERFEKTLQNWNIKLKNECARYEIGHVKTMTNIPFDNVIQKILRKGGLIA